MGPISSEAEAVRAGSCTGGCEGGQSWQGHGPGKLRSQRSKRHESGEGCVGNGRRWEVAESCRDGDCSSDTLPQPRGFKQQLF